MKVQCVPLTSFIHGHLDAHEGRAIMVDEPSAVDLERAGLVRIKRVRVRHAPPVIIDPQENNAAGKSAGGGQGQPSPALPAAPVSPTRTLRLSEIGKARTRARG